MADSASDARTWNRFGGLGSDLAVVTLLAVVIGAIQASLLPVPDPVRTVSGLLLVFVLPGYALIAALFPRSRAILARSTDSTAGFFGRAADDESDEARTFVRITLSLATSVAVSSLVGIVLGSTIGFTTSQFAIGLTSVIAVCSLIALGRRAGLEPEDRYAPAVGSRLVDASRSIGRGSPLSGAVRLVVITSLLLSMGSAAYAVSVPQQGETPTELYLLTENETGELTASAYPSTLSTTGQQTLQFGVRNREHTETRFSVVVTIDRVASTGNSSVVIERSEVDRFSNTLVPGQWWRQQYGFEPQLTGSNLRLTHYLYRGEAPAQPTVDGAYRVTYVHLTDEQTGRTANDSAPVADTVGPINRSELRSGSENTPSGTDETEPTSESTPSDSDSEQAAAEEESVDETEPSPTEEATSDDSTPSDDGSSSSDDDTTQSNDETSQPDDDTSQPDDETTPTDDATQPVNGSG